MHLSVFKLAPVVVVLGLAACGSSNTTASSSAASTSSSTTSAPATSVAPTGASDAVCAQYNTQINAVMPTPAADPSSITDASSLPAIATWIDAVVPLAQQEQTALSSAADSGPIKTPFDDVVTSFQAADTAAKGTDAGAFKTAWANFLAAQNAFQAAATGANMPNCAK